MPVDPAELERRTQAFLSAFWADEAWDSEFTPSPHSPGHALGDLVALGEAAAPVLCKLSRDRSLQLRWWAVAGLHDLGSRAGAEGLAALEALLTDDYVGARAAAAIEAVDSNRFWELRLFTRAAAVTDLTRRHRDEGTCAQWVLDVLGEDDEAAAVAALDGLRTIRGDEAALLSALRQALMSRFASVRGRAAFLLGDVPNASPAEALIEAMATSGRVTAVERIAWHPDSRILVELLVQQENVGTLAELLERRRCAGLVTNAEPLRALLEKKLRFPKREWRFEEHEVNAAARCALQLGDPALIPALVDAVVPENGGYAWGPLTEALRYFGSAALAQLEARRKTSDPKRAERLGWMLDAVKRDSLQLDWADREFVRGSIDHTTSCAFSVYSSVLRARVSAHAAFQLAWIDRAFGAQITQDRVAWIRSLGCHDESLLGELATPVVPLEGLRLLWRKCEPKDALKVAAAGLPGLAFSGSNDPTHTAQAEAHLARVRAGCAA